VVAGLDGNWLDEAWKDMLIQETDDAIEFFMPGLAADRDYTKRAELMSEDMPGLEADTDKGGRVADMCLSVHLLAGGIQRVALILEQQHEPDSGFARRIYTEFYRASDRLTYPVTSLAIFTGRKWHAGPYEYECYGTRLCFEYNVFRVAEADIESLRRDERPFAVVVLAAALMLEAGDDPNCREKYARELLGLMMERNYDKRKKKAILNFVRRVFRLQDDDMSQGVKEEWRMKAIPIEEAAKEVWIRHAREEWMERGMEAEKVEVARSMRAEGLSLDIIKRCTGLPESKILGL
jgi:hypothetical protein